MGTRFERISTDCGRSALNAIGPFMRCSQKGQKTGASGGLKKAERVPGTRLDRWWLFSVQRSLHRMITVIFFYFTGLYGDSVHPCTSSVRSKPTEKSRFPKIHSSSLESQVPQGEHLPYWDQITETKTPLSPTGNN
jgi:hypothetical protein